MSLFNFWRSTQMLLACSSSARWIETGMALSHPGKEMVSKINVYIIVNLKRLKDTARYTSLLLAPAESFGLRWFFGLNFKNYFHFSFAILRMLRFKFILQSFYEYKDGADMEKVKIFVLLLFGPWKFTQQHLNSDNFISATKIVNNLNIHK